MNKHSHHSHHASSGAHSRAHRHGHHHAQGLSQHDRQLQGERRENGDLIEPDLIDWQEQLPNQPMTDERPGNPISVTAKVLEGSGEFNSPRGRGKHHAIDTVPAEKTSQPVIVKAPLSGLVAFAGTWDEASGETIMILSGRSPTYPLGAILGVAHLEPGSMIVVPGQKVVQYQPIAIMGESGNAEKVGIKMVHYTVRVPKTAKEMLKIGLSDGEPYLEQHYKKVPPMVDGVEMKVGERFAPGNPLQTPPVLEVSSPEIANNTNGLNLSLPHSILPEAKQLTALQAKIGGALPNVTLPSLDQFVPQGGLPTGLPSFSLPIMK